MNSPYFLGLVQNIALLLSLAIVFDVLIRGKKSLNILFRQIVTGFLIGGIGVFIMLTPWVLSPGIVFDTRSVLLSVSGLFFGAVPTAIAMAITIGLRIYEGGGGALTGVLVILATGSIGIVWRHIRRHALEKINWKELYLFGVVTHLVMLALMLTLPREFVRTVLEAITLQVLAIYPLATTLLGMILINRLKRLKTQQSLQQMMSRLNATQRLACIGGWEWDVTQQSMYWTDEVYRIHGLSPEEIPPGSTEHIDKSILCYDPDDRPVILAAFQDCVENGRPYDLEFPFTTMRGERRWIRTKAEAVIEDGRVIRVMGNIMDITERKQADQALRESESRFKSLIEFAPVGIILSDRDQNTLFVNKKLTDLTGYNIEDMPSVEEWWPLAYPDEAYRNSVKEQWRVAVEISFRTNATITPLECRVSCKDGTLRYLEIGFVSTGILNIVTFVDVTQRKLAEDEIREKEAFNRTLMDNLPIGVAVNSTSPTVDFVYMNDNFPRFYRTTREELASPDAFWDAVYEDPEYRAAIKKKVLDDVASGDPKRMFWENIPITRAGRETRYISAFNTPLPEKNMMISTVVDVTDRKQIEEKIRADQIMLQSLLTDAERSRQVLLSMIEDQKEAEEHIRRLNQELENRVEERTAQLAASNKELEAFAYSVSHDLRAPLRGIDGFSRILEQEYASILDDEGKRLLGIIRSSTNKMDRLITDLLALSRVSRNDLRFEPIDMTTLVNSIYHEVAAPEVLQKFSFQVSELPGVSADPTLMRQAWSNLISNAIKYTFPKEDCRIEISGYEENGFCVFVIRDNGVGFNMRYKDKLFGLFQRLHTENEFEGTGVGLAIVQRIIHRHHGRVWAEGEVGNGAAFYFSIPQRQGNHA